MFEQGSVDWAVPALLTMDQENEMIKEKWRHLARTVLRLAQNFVQYATQKTGIIINRKCWKRVMNEKYGCENGGISKKVLICEFGHFSTVKISNFKGVKPVPIII